MRAFHFQFTREFQHEFYHPVAPLFPYEIPARMDHSVIQTECKYTPQTGRTYLTSLENDGSNRESPILAYGKTRALNSPVTNLEVVLVPTEGQLLDYDSRSRHHLFR
jgi:hypothetical protein